MRLLFGHDAEVARWVSQRIDDADFGPCVAIGVVGDAGLIAGVVYHDHFPRYETVRLSLAADNQMWAKFVPALLSYPFAQLGVYKAWAVVDSTNDRALRTDKHIGFRQEAILAHHFGRKRHGVILRMLRPDYIRLYGDRNEQGSQLVSAAAA